MNKLISKITNWFVDKSYRKKFKYYYLLTFAIPIIVIILFNVITQRVVMNQVVESNKKILKQFFNVLDERLRDITDDVYAIESEEILRNYAQLSVEESAKYGFARHSIKNLLASYKKTIYDDVFVWFASDDYVISGSSSRAGGTQGIKNYAKASYTKEERFLSEFEEIVKCESILPQFKFIARGTEEQYLCVSIRQRRTRNAKQNYTVTLIIDKKFLDNIIGEGVLEKEENVIMFDEDGAPLFSYDEPALEMLPEEYRRSGIYEVQINNRDYTILVQKSDVMKGFYVMEISHEVFFKSLSLIRTISFSGIFLSILVGIFVSLKMNQNAYNPIEMVLAFYQDKTKEKFDASRHNEFDFMIEGLRKKDEEKERILREKQEDDALRQKKELLLAVLEGKEINDTEMEMLEKQMSCSQKLFGGVLQLRNNGKVGWNQITFIVNNVFGEIFDERYQCDILSISGMQHIFILSLKEEDHEENLIELFQKGLLFLRQHLDVEAVLGTGNICNSLYGLRSMYREAQKALEYHFLLKDELIIRYEDIQDRHMQNSTAEERPLYHMVNEFVKKEKTEENTTRNFVSHLVKVCNFNTGVSMEDVENFRHEMWNALNLIWINNDLEYFQRRSYITQLDEADNLDDYLEILARILDETKKDSQDNKYRMLLAQQIKRYVEENYASPDLNVNSIGKEIGLQAAYLSRIFREEQGILLINYISSVRISNAKKLLKSTQMTLEEIAEKTGFLSVNVFINNFKKITGVTPGKYRASSRSTVSDT